MLVPSTVWVPSMCTGRSLPDAAVSAVGSSVLRVKMPIGPAYEADRGADRTLLSASGG